MQFIITQEELDALNGSAATKLAREQARREADDYVRAYSEWAEDIMRTFFRDHSSIMPREAAFRQLVKFNPPPKNPFTVDEPEPR